MSGVVGDAVFCNGTQIGPYVRKRPARKKSTPTEAQLKTRSKLVMASLILNTFRQIIQLCWKDPYRKMAPFDAAMSHLLTQGIDVSGKEAKIRYEEVRLSRGRLIKAVDTSFEIDNGEALIGWQHLGMLLPQQLYKEAIVVFYNEDMEAGLVVRDKATRGDCLLLETLPAGFLTGTIHAYLFFLSQDEKDASGTIYLGFVSNNNI